MSGKGRGLSTLGHTPRSLQVLTPCDIIGHMDMVFFKDTGLLYLVCMFVLVVLEGRSISFVRFVRFCGLLLVLMSVQFDKLEPNEAIVKYLLRDVEGFGSITMPFQIQNEVLDGNELCCRGRDSGWIGDLHSAVFPPRGPIEL